MPFNFLGNKLWTWGGRADLALGGAPGAALVAALFIGLPGAARAQGTPAAGSTPASKANGTTTTSDESDHRLSQARAISIARTDPQVAAEQRRWGHLDATPTAKPGTWQVDFYADGAERVQVIVETPRGTSPRLDRLSDRLADGA